MTRSTRVVPVRGWPTTKIGAGSGNASGGRAVASHSAV
jgi:hypothetical protein